MRTPSQWADYCRKNITAGYSPGNDKGATFESGRILVNDLLKPLELWTAGSVIVDIGSGNGRLGMGLIEEPVTYHGYEIIPGCVEFCQKAFKDLDNFHFAHLPVDNGHYYQKNGGRADRMTLPLPASSADLVICLSLFTHLGTIPVAEHYLDEIKRILKPGGKTVTTWFTSPPYGVSADEARTVYLADDVIKMLRRRFEIIKVREGGRYTGNQVLIVSEKGASGD